MMGYSRYRLKKNIAVPSKGSSNGSASSESGLPNSLSFQTLTNKPLVPTVLTEYASEYQEKVINPYQEKKKALSERLNKNIETYKSVNGQNSFKEIQQYQANRPKDTLSEPKEQSFPESVSNTGDNIVNRLEGFVPRLKVVSADVWTKVLGKELAGKWYGLEGRDLDEERRTAYMELSRLGEEVKATQGITDNLQTFDAPKLAAGVVDAMGSLVSTALPAIATLGGGVFTDMMGESIVGFNEAKAKAKGVRIDELYAKGEAEFNVPATIGAIGASMELVGLKGVQQLMTRQLKGSALKKAGIMFADVNKEGLTEWIQTGLETANISVANGKSAEDATKDAVDTMFSKRGLESYLMGVVASGGAGVAGQSLKLFRPQVKSEVSDLEKSQQATLNDIGNPNISPEAKDALIDIALENHTKIENAVNKDNREFERLSESDKDKVRDLTSKSNKLETILSDPNLSEDSKKVIQSRLDKINEQLTEIEPDSETKIAQEAKEAEKKLQDGGDQVEYEQKIAELDKRAQALTEVDNNLSEIAESVEPVNEVLPDGTIQEPINQPVDEQGFTETQRFNRERLLNGGQENGIRDLKDYAPKLYREISFNDLGEFLPNDSGHGQKDYFFSDNPDLALGQGENSGVKLEFKSDGIKGFADFSKPNMSLSFKEGKGEFQSRFVEPKTFKNNLLRIEIAPNPKRKQSANDRYNRKLDQLVSEGWTLETKEDGTRIYTAPNVQTTETQPVPEQPSGQTETATISETVNETTGDIEVGTSLRNADIAEKRKELGLSEREMPEVQTNPDLYKKAKESIDGGFDVKTLMDEIEGGKQLTPKNVVQLKLYQLQKENEWVSLNDEITQAAIDGKESTLNDLIDKRDAVLVDLERSFKVGEQGGTENARALQARKISILKDYSLGNLIGRKFKNNGGKKLTPEQVAEVTESYKKIKELNLQYEQKIKDLETENTNLLSDKAFDKIKGKVAFEQRKFGRVQERENIDKDIDATLASLKKKVKKSLGNISANPIPIEMAGDIAKLAKLYTKKGINTLAQVIDKIYTDLKDSIDGLENIHIREVLASYDYEAEAREESRLKGYKTRSQNRINELRDRIERGDFSKKVIKPIVLDASAVEIRDALRKAKREFDVELEKDRLRNRTKAEKLISDINNIKGLVKSLKASWDLSAPFRQGLVATVNHPIIASKAFIKMHEHAWSDKKYETWMNDIKDSPVYQLMQDSKLALTDTKSPNILAKEEDFSSNLGDKIPLLGRLSRGSERAYSSYLNNLRVNIFIDAANQLAEDGYTFEANPNEYKSIARVINNETGRGGLGITERHADLAGVFLWSPRLMFSRINMFTSIFDPSYSKRARITAAKDLVKFIGAASALLFLASANDDWDIEWNPLSSNFGKIKRDNVRYSVMGGMESYITLMARMLSGRTKNKKGKIVPINPDTFGGMSKLDYLGTFFRGKSSPDIGIILNLMDGKDVVGVKYNYWDVPDEVLPLVIPELFDAYREGGMDEVIKTLPFTTYGVGATRYDENKKKVRKDGIFETGYKYITGQK